MLLATANIKCNPTMSQDRVLHDIKKVRDSGAGVILWQEIAIDRYRAALTDELKDGWAHVNLDLEVPISFRTGYWELIPQLTGHVKTTDGRAHVTPNRYISYAGLRRRGTNYPPAVFMNTHMISGAYSNHYPTTKAWRLARWREEFATQNALVHKFLADGAGHTVLGGGDFNRVDLPRFTARQRWLSAGGVDHLFACEATNGIKVALNESYGIPHMYTDHTPRLANVQLHV